MIETWERRFAPLALAVQDVPPPAGLWDRIEAALDAPAADLRIIKFDGVAWEAWGPGLEVKVLTRDDHGEPESLLMRMQAGAVVPEHVHHRAEECLVIEGDLLHDGQRLGPGDFTVAQPGGIHAPMTTTSGGMLYVRYLSA
jgi:anti-sigma factor ChrR (cupin superfamily)